VAARIGIYAAVVDTEGNVTGLRQAPRGVCQVRAAAGPHAATVDQDDRRSCLTVLAPRRTVDIEEQWCVLGYAINDPMLRLDALLSLINHEFAPG
jgi:hypothetical protein